MTTQDVDQRWQEIRGIHHEHKFFYQIGGGLLLVLIGVWIGTNLFAPAEDTGYFTNVYTEVLSIFVTVFILDRLAQRREDRNREIDLKEQLVRDASSLVNDVALNAVHQIRKRGWLVGDKGILRGENLANADLHGARLQRANLQTAKLDFANLRRVNFNDANLVHADMVRSDIGEATLRETDFQGANLSYANIVGATLVGANLNNATCLQSNLQGAHLWEANLEGTYLKGANLQNARLYQPNMEDIKLWRPNFLDGDLESAKFDESTILPDGSHWTPETDMARFTDPKHPKFWRPEPGSVWWYAANGS